MDVKQVFERNSERLSALYAGQDQFPRYNALADDFRVTDHRAVQGLAHLQEMAALSGMQLRLD